MRDLETREADKKESAVTAFFFTNVTYKNLIIFQQVHESETRYSSSTKKKQ